MKPGLFILIISFFLQGSASVAQETLRCEITNDTILLGNVLELSYLAENIQVEFEGPEMQNIPVFAGPHISRTMSIINGKTTSTASYSYQIKPDRIGVISIPPAYFKKEDKIFEFPPFEIVVLPNPENLIQNKYRKKEVFSINMESGDSQKSPFINKKKKKRL